MLRTPRNRLKQCAPRNRLKQRAPRSPANRRMPQPLARRAEMRVAAILLFVVLTGTGGEIALAHAMQIVGEVQTLGLRDVLRVVARAFSIAWLWLGVGLMAVSFFAFLTMLSWYEVSFVVPATSLAYVAGAIGAWVLLHEHLSAGRWAGILLICCGVAFAWADRTPVWLTAHNVAHAFRWVVLGAALCPLIYYAI